MVSHIAVIPAKAGIHLRLLRQSTMDSRFRGNGGLDRPDASATKGKVQ
jgi:hypothetical protein